jgi:hypothetical protein
MSRPEAETRAEIIAALMLERYGPPGALQLELHAQPTREHHNHPQIYLRDQEMQAARVRILARETAHRHLRGVA